MQHRARDDTWYHSAGSLVRLEEGCTFWLIVFPSVLSFISPLAVSVVIACWRSLSLFIGPAKEKCAARLYQQGRLLALLRRHKTLAGGDVRYKQCWDSSCIHITRGG